jgi:hypothetical protein
VLIYDQHIVLLTEHRNTACKLAYYSFYKAEYKSRESKQTYDEFGFQPVMIIDSVMQKKNAKAKREKISHKNTCELTTKVQRRINKYSTNK